MPNWPFQRSRAEIDGEALLAAVTRVSRAPALYGDDRVPDTMDGRFELMTLHAVLALMRLQREDGAEALAQSFTDKLFHLFDSGLREAGTGDTAVPKRMSQMAGAFYGRLKAYAAEIDRDGPALEEALSRNVWRAERHAFAAPLARYVVNIVAMQRQAPISAMFNDQGWPSL